MADAFAHKAGLGPRPGKYQGKGVKMGEGGAGRDVTYRRRSPTGR